MILQCTGIMVGHVSPEAFCGGNIAFIQNGDIVTIDSASKTLDVVRMFITNKIYHNIFVVCMHA